MTRTDAAELLMELKETSAKAANIVPCSVGNVLNAYQDHEKDAVKALIRRAKIICGELLKD